MARPRKYKTDVPGLSPYFDKRNNKVYWRYRHPITGKNHGLGSIDQKLAETIAAEANSRLARQQMEQMLSLQEKIISDTGGSSTVTIFLNNYRKIQQERYENGEIKPEAQEQVMNDLRGHFRPEFLNRLDEIILFKPLTKDNIGGIVDLMVKELSNRLADQELSLELTDAARTQVIENGYDPVYGARPLKRYLQNYVETLAAKKILSGDVHAGDTLVLDVKDGEFVINTK